MEYTHREMAMIRHRQTLARAGKLLLTCVLAWSATPTAMVGQQAGAYTPEPGDRIRVTSVDGRLIEGRLVRLESSAIVVSQPGDETRLMGADDVGEVRVARSRVGSFAKRGAMVGGLAVGIAGIVTMSAFCQGSVDCNSGEPLAGALVGGAIGAAGGAVLGALVGAMAPGWILADPGFDGADRVASLRLDVRGMPGGGSATPHGPALGLTLALPTPR